MPSAIFAILLRDGVELTYSNPRLLAAPDGSVWLINTTDCIAHRVTDSFESFLAAYLASGLIARADEERGVHLWLTRASEWIPEPRRVEPGMNPWLRTYGSIYWT